MVAAMVLLRNQSQMPSEQRFGNRQVAIGVSIFFLASIALALLRLLLGGCLRISRNGGSNVSYRCYAEGLSMKPTKFTIKAGPLAGFSIDDAAPGEQLRIVTCASATSDKRVFHVWMKHINDVFLLHTPVPIEHIHAFLVVLHEDNSADIYINDFGVKAEIKVKEGVKPGQSVLLDNLSDVRRVFFDDIEVQKSDAVVYGRRTDWRFSIYFDFRRQLDLDELSLSLGALKNEAIFFASMAAADARIADEDVDAFVYGEGKTDWKHLFAAAMKLQVPYSLSFDEEGYGAADLLQMCQHFARMRHSRPIIFIFDRDDKEIMKKLKAKDTGGGYQEWGNNVFSMYLPIPPGRADETHTICIEFFYPDADLKGKEQSGTRLYLNSEFNETTGMHSSGKLVCQDRNLFKRKTVSIVDHDVFDVVTRESVALSKEAFAAAIYDGPPYDEVTRPLKVSLQ
jgi:hypothetical protein